MRHLFIPLLLFALTSSAQLSIQQQNFYNEWGKLPLGNTDTTKISDRINAKLDTSARGDVSAGTKSLITTKRGSARADTFAVPVSGVVDLQPWLTANGFTSMLVLGAIPYRNPGGGSNAAQLYISAWTPTTVTLNVTVQNTAVVQILGVSVLSGLPLVTPAAGVVKAYLSFVAYQ